MSSLERRLIKSEIRQRSEEGCNVEEISNRVDAAITTSKNESTIYDLYEELIALPIDRHFPFQEPSDFPTIKSLRPEIIREPAQPMDEKRLRDRIYGGWLGRASGCALGKPIEGWPKKRIDSYLTRSEALPLKDFCPFDERFIPRIHKPSTRGNISFMDRDDDMDFPILGLLALERSGNRLSAKGIAHTWVTNLPFGKVYTAEQVAYRNFVNNIWPPDSASHRNPFREWIGAQIRADIFGYAAPGWPEKAAELAFKDASISHTKNGIYGEMFVAAMISAAFVHTSVDEIINAGLGEIPKNCRLAAAVRETITWCREEENWEAVWARIDASYGKYHGVHTINNAALVVMGLIFGSENFETGIVTTVRGGWDTDCNGATVGSILGVKFGAQALPSKWTRVFNDTLKSAVQGHEKNKISQLAERTLRVAISLREDVGKSPAPDDESNLQDNCGGIWLLETGWGTQLLDFTLGTIRFVNYQSDGLPTESDDIDGPYKLVSASYQNPELKFSFAIDKGGWDFEVDFDGSVSSDRLEGFFYPGEAPVKGVRQNSA